MNRFGECECGGQLDAIWFEEQESKISGGMLILTNRYRKAVSHLSCTCCGKNYCVDGTFDGQWYEKNR